MTNCSSSFYDSDFTLWFSVDPMSDKYPSMSPYNYYANNPVSLVDPYRKNYNPIFDLEGNFIGTDDKGLKGEAIIIQKSLFIQNMKHTTAESVGTYRSKYKFTNSAKDFNILNKIDNFMTTLPSRPDYDEIVTFEEAKQWYREGSGQPLFADFSKLNLKIRSSDIKIGARKTIKVINYNSSLDNFFVYASITIKRTNEITIRPYADEFDVEMQNAWNPLNWLINIETFIGSKVANDGVPFEINLTVQEYLDTTYY